MTRFLIDLNVVLDLVLDRQPYAKAATALWGLAEAGEIEAVVPAHGVTTVYYLAARERGAAFAHRVVNDDGEPRTRNPPSPRPGRSFTSR